MLRRAAVLATGAGLSIVYLILYVSLAVAEAVGQIGTPFTAPAANPPVNAAEAHTRTIAG